MTPTKVASPTAGDTKENTQGDENKGPPSAVEFEPPLACVRRILKHSLPSSTNVGKDASAAFARASGIFIIYLTACANDFARENRRQTITANDVLAAIKELEFDEFTPELNEFLERYRALEKSKKEAKAKAAASKAVAEDDDEDEQKEPATPQSTKSKDTDGADVSMADDGDQSDDEEKDGDDDTPHGDDMAEDGEDDDDAEDMLS